MVERPSPLCDELSGLGRMISHQNPAARIEKVRQFAASQRGRVLSNLALDAVCPGSGAQRRQSARLSFFNILLRISPRDMRPPADDAVRISVSALELGMDRL